MTENCINNRKKNLSVFFRQIICAFLKEKLHKKRLPYFIIVTNDRKRFELFKKVFPAALFVL